MEPVNSGNKPREWWIEAYPEEYMSAIAWECIEDVDEIKNTNHVIEYSAYQALKEENEMLGAEINKMQDEIKRDYSLSTGMYHKLYVENERLKEENERWRDIAKSNQKTAAEAFEANLTLYAENEKLRRKSCSLSLTCEGGIFECMREELQSENERLRKALEKCKEQRDDISSNHGDYAVKDEWNKELDEIMGEK